MILRARVQLAVDSKDVQRHVAMNQTVGGQNLSQNRVVTLQMTPISGTTRPTNGGQAMALRNTNVAARSRTSTATTTKIM